MKPQSFKDIAIEKIQFKINKLVSIRNRTGSEWLKIHLDSKIFILEELKEELMGVNEWIDVKERLPEEEWEYLVFSGSWKIRIAKFQKAINFDNDAYFYIDNPNPKKTENSYIPIWPKTWMPVPHSP